MTVLSRQRKNTVFSYGDFVWWVGYVVDRDDPEKLGRLKIKVFGYNDSNEVSADNLFWAHVLMPVTSSSMGGVRMSPTGIQVGSTVMGFYMDGHAAQQPIVLGTFHGVAAEQPLSQYRHETGNYSIGEQDTDRLARNEKTSQTLLGHIGKTKQEKIGKPGDPPGQDQGSMKEPKTKYNAKYPYNMSWNAECGSEMEMDSTPGAERFHIWHKEGTFWEIFPDGKSVWKTFQDNYDLHLTNYYQLVKNDSYVNVKCNAYIKVEGNVDIEVHGNQKELIHGNYDLEVKGNFTTKVEGNTVSITKGTETRQASMIFLN